jgi:DnaD/phage-associated family protein
MGQLYELSGLGAIFAVPSAVVDKHIKMCGEVSLKALLMLLRTPDAPPDVEEMARRLGKTPGDITDALSYWVEAGILRKSGSEPAAPQPQTAPASPTPSAVQSKGRPRLPRREMLGLIEQNGSLKGLVDEIQMVLGKPLTSSDMDAIVALYSYYGLSAHYIMTVVQYCDAIGKPNMRYIERTAASWQDQGVTGENIDDHVARMLLYRSAESQVRRDLGLYDRALAPSEQRYLNRWLDTMGLSPELIRTAYDIAATQTGKLSFAYMDKVLTSWHQKGIADEAAALAEHAAGRPSTPPAKKGGTKPSPGNKQSFDTSRLERLIEAKAEKEVEQP